MAEVGETDSLHACVDENDSFKAAVHDWRKQM